QDRQGSRPQHTSHRARDKGTAKIHRRTRSCVLSSLRLARVPSASSRAWSVPVLNDRSSAKRRETMANDRLLHFLAQLPLRRVWNDVAGCHCRVAFLLAQPRRGNAPLSET